MQHSDFGRSRSGSQTAVASVVAHADVGDVNVVVIHVVDRRNVHSCDGAIVGKISVVPISAVIPTARIAVAVVDAAVETDVRSPISPM